MITDLFHQVTKAVEANKHGWTSTSKACIIAASIVALRPKFSVEIGVYAGKGLISMALAHRAIGRGIAIGVDPYSADASKEGQIKPEDQKFWSELNHDAILKECQRQIKLNGVEEFCRLEIKRSDAYDPPDGIGVLRVDANHGPECINDIRRYSPFVQRGGLLILDDKNWAGGAVLESSSILTKSGWRSLYEVKEPEGEVWEVFQKL